MSPGRIFRHFPPFTTAFLLALAVLCCGVYRSLSPDVQASRNNGSQARLRRLTFRNNDSFVRGGEFVSARPVSQVRAFIGAASVLSGTAENGGLFLALRKLRL